MVAVLPGGGEAPMLKLLKRWLSAEQPALPSPPADAAPEKRGRGAHSIVDWHGDDGRFMSAEKQREALAATVSRCTSPAFGRNLRLGMQVTRSGGAAMYAEWDSSWQRPWVNDGEPVDRAEQWAAAVDPLPAEEVAANRAAAGMRDDLPAKGARR